MQLQLIFPLVACAFVSTISAQSFVPENTVPDSDLVDDSSTFARSFYFCKNGSNDKPTYFQWRTNAARSFVQSPDGTARLRGTIQDRNNSNNRLTVDVRFTGFRSQTQTPPSGSPKLGPIKDSALRESSGPIDPNGWSYYTGMTGTLVGSNGLAGWRLRITRRGEAFQLGFGASQKNGNYGASNWFNIRFDSRGRNWNPGSCGDINTDLRANEKDCVALYAFKDNKRDSTDGENCSDSFPVVFGRTVVVERSGQVTLRDEDWKVATTRSRSVSNNAYLELRFRPKDGKQIDLERICFDLARNQYAVTRTVDVRYDDDPGSSGNNFNTVVRSISLPNESGTQRAFRRFCIELNSSRLQNLTKETRIRLYFWGTSRFSTSNNTWIDNICLEGGGESKVPNIARTTPTTQPIVTTECFKLTGCGFTNVKEVNFGKCKIDSTDPCDFGKGYFQVVSDEEMCIYPPLCKPGTFAVTLVDTSDRLSNASSVRMVNPSDIRIANAPRWDSTKRQTFWMWGGVRRPYYCLFMSPFNKPTRVPGLVDLGIGNNFEFLFAFDGPGSICYEFEIERWFPAVKGQTLYFQAIVIDLDNLNVFPIPSTNVTSTRYF